MQQDETVVDTQYASGGRIWLGVIILLFVCVRLPAVLHAPASQDEEWYGVPGLTVATEGIPRVPYCRAREEGSVFQGAEQVLFAQPPLSFYTQAPFFIVLPPGCSAARISSVLSACLAIVLVFSIGQQLFCDRRVSLIAAALYSFSRLLFFPAMSSRPDMLCGMLGLVSVYCMLRWKHQPNRAAVSSGVCLGLAGLTHPFAIVFAVQVGIWNAIRSGGVLQRFSRCVLLVAATAITFAIWIPLIATATDLFKAQFVGNILRPAGPGLLARFVMPMDSFANQIPQLFQRAHPIQFVVLAGGLVMSGVISLTRRNRNAGLCWLLAVSSIYLLVVCVGIHPIQGFWCYPAAFAWICVAYALVSGFDGCSAPRVVRIVLTTALFGLLLPGAGLRATWTYIVRWDDTNYASRHFVRQILVEVPDEATVAVGREFALDAYGSGRDIILACRHPMYFDSTEFPTDFLIIGRRDHEEQMIEGYESAGYRPQRLKSFGNPDDPLSCYAELWSIQLD